MLLRRIKGHIVNENWFAVFVDFVIVVVGVYVGIEVSNWNDARQEDTRAIEYLERIRADLEFDRVTLNYRLVFWDQVLEFGEEAIAHAETGKLVNDSPAATVLAYFQASQVAPFTAVNTTYEEIKSAGDFRLIEDQKLLANLAEYYLNSSSLQEQHLFQLVPEYRETIRGIMPWSIHEHVWTHCHSAEGNTQQLRDCDLPISEADATVLLEEIATNTQAVRELRFWITNLTVSSNVLSANDAEIGTLLAQIDESLAGN